MSAIKRAIEDLEEQGLEPTNDNLKFTMGACKITYKVETPFEQVGKFHKSFSHNYYVPSTPVKVPDAKTLILRLKLITEELEELVDGALGSNSFACKQIKEAFITLNGEITRIIDEDISFDPVEVADALGDISYVVNGAAHAFNMDLDAITTEIQRSNMSKLGEDGKPIIREDGKILKGPGYFKPDIKKVLDETNGVSE